MITQAKSSRRPPDGIRAACSASLAMDQRQERLLLADGKRRKVSRPKAKKLGHVRQLTEVRQEYDHPAIHKLRQGEPVSDRELRRALAAFKEGITLGER